LINYRIVKKSLLLKLNIINIIENYKNKNIDIVKENNNLHINLDKYKNDILNKEIAKNVKQVANEDKYLKLKEFTNAELIKFNEIKNSNNLLKDENKNLKDKLKTTSDMVNKLKTNELSPSKSPKNSIKV
jgi:hypothetical protein